MVFTKCILNDPIYPDRLCNPKVQFLMVLSICLWFPSVQCVTMSLTRLSRDPSSCLHPVHHVVTLLQYRGFSEVCIKMKGGLYTEPS